MRNSASSQPGWPALFDSPSAGFTSGLNQRAFDLATPNCQGSSLIRSVIYLGHATKTKRAGAVNGYWLATSGWVLLWIWEGVAY